MYLHPLTRHLPQFERDDLQKLVSIKSYKRNQRLLANGEKSERILCVASGLLRVSLVCNDGGGEVITDFVRREEFFLPQVLQNDDFDSAATVVAALPSDVYEIPLSAVRALCIKYPYFTIGLLEHESKRLGALRMQLQRVTTCPTEKLIDCVMHELAKIAPSEGGGYDKRISQANIASYAGVSREVVNKKMKSIESRGLEIKG
ncbi:Crp/Fnr family transcriptional regulator [Variovorax sp. UMC13]|uniref:Crp/Fnr family transcriptional regulator n=1 Tax=Variovorax sp. UMC13 TaxID=1862326 RepID=UPI00160184AB|nr:Crp/Fnr family transcriptional regulator [Variovorax sp. UMC13]MBB1603802.1 hypothetical protein [Variovorax sp. UMC13]